MPLKHLIKQPLSVKEFIELVLYHPVHGYYMTQPIFGSRGDYITAPEMTQVFGELLAVYFLNYLQYLPTAPSSVVLVELGPGRGTLMKDMLRIFPKFPWLYGSLRVYLIETSPLLKEQQRQALAGFSVEWVKNLNDIPPSDTTFIVANEFFDALPIEQYIYTGQQWVKRQVGWKGQDIGFLDNQDMPIRQECPDYDVFIQPINHRLKDFPGAALIIDYGDDTEPNHIHGDTLQSLHKHNYASPFDNIGQQDLSHAVDFGILRRLVDPSLRINLQNQKDFLFNLGLEQRIISLCEKASLHEVLKIQTAAAKLVAAKGMGYLFKVMTIENL